VEELQAKLDAKNPKEEELESLRKEEEKLESEIGSTLEREKEKRNKYTPTFSLYAQWNSLIWPWKKRTTA